MWHRVDRNTYLFSYCKYRAFIVQVSTVVWRRYITWKVHFSFYENLRVYKLMSASLKNKQMLNSLLKCWSNAIHHGSRLSDKLLFVSSVLNLIAYGLTLSPPITTIVPYENSSDPGETQSTSVSHPNPNCLKHRQYFHLLRTLFKHFENWSRRES